MKKNKNLLLLSSLILLLGIFEVLLVYFWDRGQRPNRLTDILIFFVPTVIVCGGLFLLFSKIRQGKLLPKLLVAGNIIALCLLLVFGCFCVSAINYPGNDAFSVSTTLFDNKNVLIVVPHQDDDTNLMGGLIEQYTRGNSEVSVVFLTNGDGDLGSAEIRFQEAVSVLTALGVKKEHVYFLGFGDLWVPQTFEGQTVRHIYNSPDPDAVWTSLHGATATYGFQSIPCYQELPYTRNNYVSSLESLILQIMPDTIFAGDFDAHMDHKAADLFFEEALCNVLKSQPDYHPTVYKGFCYATAWKAEKDFYDNLNLLSTKKPDDDIWNVSSFGYAWEDRVRFPETNTNLNPLLTNNSVYRCFNGYGSQFAYIRAEAVLNGDKVFWHRRTDSLLYGSEILVNGEATSRLNDFKLKDFADLSLVPETCSSVVSLTDTVVRVTLPDAVTASCIYLYDHPSLTENILEGYIAFDDGSSVEFGQLRKDGSATIISFPEKEIRWFEIVASKTEGDWAGLSEIELFRDGEVSPREAFLMAVDSDDNFVYDHIIPEGTSASFTLYQFPHAQQITAEDVTISFESDDAGNSYSWEGDTFVVNCAKGSKCTVTVSSGGNSTTFTVSNPTGLTRGCLKTLRFIEKLTVDIRYLLFGAYQVYYRITE